MDPTNHLNDLDSTYRLLALCARAKGHPVFYQKLAHQISQFTAWQELPSQAELHGMAPLLRHHLQQANISIPAETQLILNGLYLRHRLFNQISVQTLIGIMKLFEQANIRPLLLKGLALGYQYYPDPALRPISDIDLFFKQEEVLPALHLLADTGFSARFPNATLKRIPKELIADSPLKDGISVHVELHHYDPKHRYEKGNSPDPEFAGFHSPPQAVEMDGTIVYTSAPMETLHYLMRHLVKHMLIANTNKPVQLKWTADIISLVECHAKEMDWREIQQHHPDILNRLKVLYSLTPMPVSLEKIIPVGKVSLPSGLNQYPPGWPHQSIKQWKQVGFLRFIWQVFVTPSDWWLRLHYGINEQSLFWHRHILYRINILGAIFWRLIRKLDS